MMTVSMCEVVGGLRVYRPGGNVCINDGEQEDVHVQSVRGGNKGDYHESRLVSMGRLQLS